MHRLLPYLPPLTVRVAPGYVIPKWAGVAYRDWSRDEAVCTLVGLNLVVRACHWLWWMTKQPRWGRRAERHAGDVAQLQARVAVLNDEVDHHRKCRVLLDRLWPVMTGNSTRIDWKILDEEVKRLP